MHKGQGRTQRQEATGRTLRRHSAEKAEGLGLSDHVLVPGVIRHKEQVTRLLADRCEFCKDTDGISVHHVRRLADLHRPGQPQPGWTHQMARWQRKILVVCRSLLAD